MKAFTNKLKTLTILILISFTLQFVFFCILDNFVLKKYSKFSSEKIESTVDSDKVDINIVIPTDAKNIDLSYEGRYVAFNSNNALYIENTETKNTNEILINKNESIIHYTWVENRDILIIIKKINTNECKKIQLVTYNAKKDTQQVVKDICNYNDTTDFKEITTSVLTGVYYINILHNNKNIIYRIDRNDALEIVDTKTLQIYNIKTMKHTDRLIYQSKENNIYITNPNNKLTLNNTNKLLLLDVDTNDNVYVGKIVEDKITNIFYGKLNDNSVQWKDIKLDMPLDKSDIYINSKSEILINNKTTNSIENLITKQKIEYRGTLIKVTDKFIASLDENNNLIYTRFN